MTSFDTKALLSSNEVQITKPIKLTNPSQRILRFLSSGILASCELETLNKLELNAIKNAIAYVAFAENVEVSTVTDILTSAFEVEEVKDISSKHYEQAIRFLIELNTKLIIS